MKELFSMNVLNLILVSTLFTLCYGIGCKISIDLNKEDVSGLLHPLILSESYEILQPDRRGVLHFSKGQKILLACGEDGFANPASYRERRIIKASCVGNKEFSVQANQYSFDLFACIDKFSTAYRESGSCLKTFSRVELGFDIPSKFIPVMEICRDRNTLETFYAKSEYNASISGRQIGKERGAFSVFPFFVRTGIANDYTIKNQEKILKEMVGEELAEQYMATPLQRGHLAAFKDFVYASEQDITMTYVNVAPQWRSFNIRNWKTIEDAIRRFVVDKDLKVTIYTGVHGEMTLENKRNREQPLNLHNNKKYTKVPLYFWKVIYRPDFQQALAIVGVNDPIHETTPKQLCKDISDDEKIDWFKNSVPQREIIEAGYSYTCRYEDLKKVVTTVPELRVNGILRGY